MKRGVRIGLKIAAFGALALIFFAGMAVVTLRSPWLHEKIRQRVVTEIEKVTGGTATLGNWAVDWRLWTAHFDDLTLRGKEPLDAPALLHAKSVKIGVKIISFWKKDVDIASLEIVEPKVNIIVAADGSTNIPEPKVKRTSGKIGLEPLLDWKIGKLSLENGTLLFAEKKHDFNLSGEKLHAQFSYDFTGPRYQGQLTIEPLNMVAPGISPVNTNVYMTLGLERNRIEVSSAKLDMGRSNIEAAGVLDNFSSPHLAFQFKARVSVAQAASVFRFPGVRQGMVDLAGAMNYESGSRDYNVVSSVNARDVDVEQDGIRIRNVRLSANMVLEPRGMDLNNVVLDALGGRFTGKVALPELKRFTVDGTARDFPIQQALAALGPDLPAASKTTWSGVGSGPIHVDGGLRGGPFNATAKIEIVPAPGGIPLAGTIDASYDGSRRTLNLGQSSLLTPGARVDVFGVLGTQLHVQASSTNLNELLPAINAFSKTPLESMPIQLKGGKAMFDGTITGKFDSPVIAGEVAANRFTYAGIDLDSFAGLVRIDQSALDVQSATLARGAARARLAGNVKLSDWKALDSSAIEATAALNGAQLAELLNAAGQKEVPVSGALTGSARVSGTVAAPQGSAEITLTKGIAYDEPFDRLQASFDYSARAVNLRQVTITAGPAQITGSASFEPTQPFSGVPGIGDGQLQFQVSTNNMAVEKFENAKRRFSGFTGIVHAKLQGAAAIHNGGSTRVNLTSLNADITTQGAKMDDRPIGNIKANARTEGSVLKVQLDSDFLNSNLAVNGQWRLEPGYPGEATARFSKVSLETVSDWLARSSEGGGPNFYGSAEGTVTISGPAFEPRGWKGSAQLVNFELRPREQGPTRSERFVLRNEGPVALTMERSVVNVTSAHFKGPSTDVRVTGNVLLEPKPTLDLKLNGDVNLAVAQSFSRDIESSGSVTLNAAVRGGFDQPLVNGSVEVKSGALHFIDTPTGLTAANGSILFNGTQAIIQDFIGTVGGGQVKLNGVVGYARGELSYRVDVGATDVRVRYPEGASTSANAELSLRGTSQRSTLSGAIFVTRTGFNPRTDFSSILGKAAEPVRTPSARVGPLSGMRFDVRIETAPNISFESSLTQDIQVEGNLRLQGTPYNPVLLGRLNITQGEVNFFGTKYMINQGALSFTNPVKMEPVLNVDLETRVQGIDVTLTVSGPLTKLVVTPRSDPPLEYSQVLALLTTGSAPSNDPTLTSRQSGSNQSFTQLGASALVGQVVANPVSSRLQRFFGVSKLKIDPQLTGVENNPQARLTLEQQVSKNLTFTYITNLNSSNQQIVRVEWALSRTFSVIAVRDENGLFGIDFLHKKSFK